MIKIVSDTTTGLTRELTERHDIDLVSQVVMFGPEVLRDGVDITNEVFLQRLKMSKEFPKTSQPPVGDFVTVFKKHLDAGHDVLCITVSDGLSGTYNSATQAKQQLGSDRITIIDSKNVAAAEALIVLEAVRLAKAGQSMAEIVACLDVWVKGMHLDFVLDTLEYLVRGGRASNLQGLLGTLLQMKPVLTIRHGTGKIEALERIRTRNKAHARLRAIIDAAVRGKRQIHMSVVHTALLAEAEVLAQELRQAYNLDECLVLEMPPAVAAHTGPGALGVAYYVED
ncbi:MAG TPA: DegV family protein [Anaerolineae bacterium]